MKYRCLTYEEFDLLKTDFSDFLYQEGISNYEWKLLQDQYSSNAIALLERYSDLTFEKVIQEVKYLEGRKKKSLYSICCFEEHMEIIGIEIPSFSSVDLTDISSIESIHAMDLSAYRSFKKQIYYNVSREHHIFQLIESGFYVVDERSFNCLSLLRQSYEN